ncbi:unnamed protein product, partial [Mesorhabditis spiculigera]
MVTIEPQEFMPSTTENFMKTTELFITERLLLNSTASTAMTTQHPLPDCICSPIVTGPPFGRVPDGIEDVCAPNTGFLGCKSNSNSPVADRELMRFRLYDESGNTIHDSGPYCSAEATKYATKSCECRTALAKGATINAPFCKGVRTPYWTCTNYGYDPDRCGDI